MSSSGGYRPPRAGSVRHLDPATTPVAEPRPAALLPGQYVEDAFGDIWHVRQSRGTNHGFEIYLGRPREATGPSGSTVILTADLAAHLEKHRWSAFEAMDLPLGGTTIGRLRRLLGHHRYQDAEMWWLERIQDLERMTIADFAARHRVSTGAVSQARRALADVPAQRNANWWRTPEMVALWHSKQPTASIAAKLGLSAVTVRKYRAKTGSAS